MKEKLGKYFIKYLGNGVLKSKKTKSSKNSYFNLDNTAVRIWPAIPKL